MSDSDEVAGVKASGYAAALAEQLAGLATLANQSLGNLYLPGDWEVIYTHSAGSAAGGCQYYLAAYPRQQPTTCALIVGAPWSDFISYYTPDDNHLLAQVNAKIVGNHTDVISADTGFVQMYGAIRTQLWADIARTRQSIPAFATTLPLIVAGLGPGAPVAQLASLDLRPGKTSSPSQVATLSSYVFSCVPAVDAAFARFFAANVPAGYRVQAGADQFAAQPLAGSGYVSAGAQQNLALKIPVYDCPWVERDGPYYQQLLGGAAPAPTGSGVTNDVAGFDPVLAFAMAKLLAVAYQMNQHPGSVVAFQYNPYVLKQNISINGTVWASLFESPDNLVVAWRGTVTWMELMQLVSNAFPSAPAWISADYGQYAKPLADLYAGGRGQLSAALNALGDKPLLLTGHDAGGAMANLMAVDLLQNPLQGQRGVAAVYTFGSPPAANPTFVNNFAASALVGRNFQVARPMDIVPALPLLGFLATLGTPVTLTGGQLDPYNGATYHALLTYLNLLNPGD